MHDNYNSEIERSIKVVETIGIQKKVLEEENDELRSRISDLLHERSQLTANTKKKVEMQVTPQHSAPVNNGVPLLNLAKTSGERNFI